MIAMRTIFVFAAAALAPVAVVTPAAAEQVAAAVPYSDVDLSTAAGTAALDRSG
jgi:UrcA family protein